MKEYKILLSIGPDQPGIVDDVSSLLYRHDANIEDSRMAALGGCFSIMALFSFDAGKLEAIQTGLKELEQKGVQISLHDAFAPPEAADESGAPLEMSIQAMDHPGIVQMVVHLLHRYGLNITSLQTRVFPAPVSGSPLFALELAADAPAGVDVGQVKADLLDLAAREDLDVDFR